MVSGLDTIFGDDSQSSTVPSVTPEDLKSVWMMQKECQASSPNQGLAISADLYIRACQPGADVRAVFERVSQIGLLQMSEVLTPWLQDGMPNDAVFDVLATIPMRRMQVGIVYNGLPFDVEEFVKQVERRAEN